MYGDSRRRDTQLRYRNEITGEIPWTPQRFIKLFFDVCDQYFGQSLDTYDEITLECTDTCFITNLLYQWELKREYNKLPISLETDYKGWHGDGKDPKTIESFHSGNRKGYSSGPALGKIDPKLWHRYYQLITLV